MKLILLLGILAVSSATVLDSQKNILVNVGEGNIVITNKDGRQVNIVTTKPSEASLKKTIQVQVSGPGLIPKTLQVTDQQVTAGGKYQSEILYQIFNKYNGQIDEKTYGELIGVISGYVQSNEIDPVVLYALQTVDYQNLRGVNVEQNPFIQSRQTSGQKSWQRPRYIDDEDIFYPGAGHPHNRPHYKIHSDKFESEQESDEESDEVGEHSGLQTTKQDKTLLGKETRGKGYQGHLVDNDYVRYLLQKYQRGYGQQYGYPGQYLGGHQQQYGDMYGQQYGQHYRQPHGQHYGPHVAYGQQNDQYEPYGQQYDQFDSSQQYQPYGQQYKHQYGQQYDQYHPFQQYEPYGQQYGYQYGRYGQQYSDDEQQHGGYGKQYGGYGQQYGSYGQHYGGYGQQYGRYGKQYDQQHQEYQGPYSKDIYSSGSGHGLSSTILRKVLLGSEESSQSQHGQDVPIKANVITIEEIIVREPKQQRGVGGPKSFNDYTTHHELYVNGVPVMDEPSYVKSHRYSDATY